MTFSMQNQTSQRKPSFQFSSTLDLQRPATLDMCRVLLLRYLKVYLDRGSTQNRMIGFESQFRSPKSNSVSGLPPSICSIVAYIRHDCPYSHAC